MKKITALAMAAIAAATAAYALPGDLLVVSDKEVLPDEAAGFYYLGTCAAGYLYSGSAAAIGRAAPYRVLDDGRGKHYFLLSLPKRTALTVADMETVGVVRQLGDEYLLAVARPGDVGLLLAVEPRLRVRELRPTVRVRWRAAAEEPPAKKNATVEAAIKTINADEYAGYIGQLQSYGTRYSFTPGVEASRNWLRNWYAGQNLDADWHAFGCGRYRMAHYPEAGGNIYLDDYHCMARRSQDDGASWDTLRPAKGTAGPYYRSPACWWFDSDNGIFAGIDGYSALTADGGNSWQYMPYEVLSPGDEVMPLGLCFATSKIGWLSYYYTTESTDSISRDATSPIVIKTEDGGLTWREAEWNIPFPRFDRLATYDAKRMWALHYAVGSGARVYYSDDGGTNWTECVASIASDEYVFDAAAVGPREAWAATTEGRVLHTTNGVDWQEVDTGFTGTFMQVEFPTRTLGYIAGAPVIKTEDGGLTWTRVTSVPAFECYNMAFADGRHGVITDYYGDAAYITADGGTSWADISRGLNVPEYNVVAERRGTDKPDEIVIIGGHYDSISTVRPWDCPGAEDNASGAACAMAAARAFRNVNFERTVRFMGFGDEEAGLLGSEAYANDCAAKGEKIVAVLNADMVSYDEENGVRDDLLVGAPEDSSWLVAYLQAVGALYGQELIYDWDDEWISDDESFINVGYPALGLIEGGSGEGAGFGLEYPWYHTPGDTLDKIQPEFGARCARDLAATVAHLAGVAGTFPDPPLPGGVAAVPRGRPFTVYPNPYCYTTTTAGVSFVGLKTPATVEIYDLAGRRVVREEVKAGSDEYVWSPGGEALAPGVYLYRVEGEGQEEAGKVVVAK